MSKLQILAPDDQPSGKVRLLQELRQCLHSDDYGSFLMTVAFVKVGPLIRLQSEIESWLAKGNTIEAIWGINHKGTSQEAIAFALHYFTKTHVLFSGESVTFHPKMYLFFGPKKCRFFVGSHNLTVGGTETNWEAGIKLDATLPEDQATADAMLKAWQALIPSAVQLTPANFPNLIASGLLLDESKAPARGSAPPHRAPPVRSRRKPCLSSQSSSPSLRAHFPQAHSQPRGPGERPPNHRRARQSLRSSRQPSPSSSK